MIEWLEMRRVSPDIYIGRVFGHLQVTGATGNTKKRGIVTAVCRRVDEAGQVCGKTWRGRLAHLTRGATKSCGCLRIARGRNRRHALGLAALKAIGGLYKRQAATANRLWNLTLSQVEQLITSTCWYGGVHCEPNIKVIWTYGDQELRYVGIDKVDPIRGYVDGNVVPCCWKHNETKKDSPPQLVTELGNGVLRFFGQAASALEHRSGRTISEVCVPNPYLGVFVNGVKLENYSILEAAGDA